MLIAFMYYRNKDNVSILSSENLITFPLYERKKLLLLVGFLLVLPLMSYVGRRQIDLGNDNVVLLVLFLLIPTFVWILSYFRKSLPEAIYPFSLGIIGLSILLSRSLISNYLIGGDIYTEYNSFVQVLSHHKWSTGSMNDAVMGSLSISLLPVMLKTFLGIPNIYIFKLALIIPLAFIPIIGYLVYKKWLNPFYGFLSAFFMITQLPFFYSLSGQLRLGVALVSFILIFMVFFDEDINAINKKILSLILIITMILEYYVLPVIFLVLIFFTYAILSLKKERKNDIIGHILILFTAVVIYIWWGQISSNGFNLYILFSKDIFINLFHLFEKELYSPTITNFITPTDQSLAARIPGIYMRITLLVTAFGIIPIILLKKYKKVFPKEYIILMASCLILIVSSIIVPKLSYKYGIDRIYLQLMTIFAPSFIIGCEVLLNAINAPKIFRSSDILSSIKKDHVIVLLISMQFIFCSLTYNELIGVHAGEILDAQSPAYKMFYIYDAEVRAADWLSGNTNNQNVILGNLVQPFSKGIFEFTVSDINKSSLILWFDMNISSKNNYTFLQNVNIKDKIINAPEYSINDIYIGTRTSNISDFEFIYIDKNKIYDNRYSMIFW